MNIRPELLTHQQIPKPLHGVNPRTIFGDTWWNKERKIAYAKNDYHCHACGVHKSQAKFHEWLEAHEAYDYDYPNGKLHFREIVALCHSCHNYIHAGRLIALLQTGKISRMKYDIIVIHGSKILEKHNLKKREYTGKLPAWNDWRLVIDNKEYAPLYKSYAEWLYNFSPDRRTR